MSDIALWFYRNEGGDGILTRLTSKLRARGHRVYSDFDPTGCVVVNGLVESEDGVILSDFDLLYYMNADEQSDHQADVFLALELCGVRLINSVAAYRIAHDKFLANTVLRQAGVRVPRSLLVNATINRDRLEALTASWPAIVIKRRRGHGGAGVQLFESVEAAYDYIQATGDLLANFYLEEFVPFGELDCRVDMVRSTVVGSYSRRRHHRFKTNGHARAEMVARPAPAEAIAVAQNAAQAIGIDCTIVDLVQRVGTSDWYVIEVNPLLGVFVEAGIITGVNTIHTVEDLDPVYCYDERKLEVLAAELDAQLRSTAPAAPALAAASVSLRSTPVR